MNISWYPWQLFIRKKEVAIPVIIVALASIALAVWLEVALQRVPQPVFLHYSVELGVDALGSAASALVLSAFMMLVLIINTIIANILFLSYKIIARVVLWSTLPIAMGIFWFGTLILHVNGA